MKASQRKRGGNKRKAAQSVDPAEAARLQAVIERTGTLSNAEVAQVLKADTLPCALHDKTCKGKAENPNCLCGLIPALESSRRQGLWQRDVAGMLKLGPDPSMSKREEPRQPVGLNNLGNTCYVNSALQCLFMNPVFRSGVYAMQPPLSEEPVLGQLRSLFAQLQAGPRSSVDPTAFAKGLQLDHTIQQDGQEFLKLLLSLLERRFADAEEKELQVLVQSLFRGRYAYETICQSCSQPSESSRRATDFYELDLSIKGFATLAQSLMSALEVEELRGDNQYRCDLCQRMVDASRQLRLRALPPYLCLSLKRFVFDLRAMNKVKVSDKFRFPLALDLGAYLPPELAAEGAQYELTAILIHKGSSASHGHYVAHVKSEETLQWWRFDDETSSLMERGPVGECGDHGVASTTDKSGAPAKARGRKPGRVLRVEEPNGKITKHKYVAEVEASPSTNFSSVPSASPAANQGTASRAAGAAAGEEPGSILSANAYMLMYRRCGWQYSGSLPLLADQIPDSLQLQMRQQVQDFNASCEQYKLNQEQMTSALLERRASIRRVLEAAPVADPAEECRWISAAWLSSWADSEEAAPPVDNAPLLCEHSHLDPTKVPEMKRISMAAWQQLVETHMGGPELSSERICMVCARESLAGIAASSDMEQFRIGSLAVLEDAEKAYAAGAQPEGFFVSKTWLQGWKKRGGRSGAGAAPTDGITCPHGQLLPESFTAKARRQVVPTDVWQFLVEDWKRAEQMRLMEKAAAAVRTAELARQGHESDPDVVCMTDSPAERGSSGAPATPSDAEDMGSAPPNDAARDPAEFELGAAYECAQCRSSLEASVENMQAHRQQAGGERAVLGQLAAGAVLYLEPGERYNLVPAAWLQTWRSYMAAAAKKAVGAGSVRPPPPLPALNEEAACSCHEGTAQGLIFAAPTVTSKRGKWSAVEVEGDYWELISAADWQLLQQRYGSEGDTRQVAAWLEVESVFPDASAPQPLGSFADEVVIGPDLLQIKRPLVPERNLAAHLLTQPPVCQLAVAERAASLKKQRLTYTDAEIMVELVRVEDATAECSAAPPTGERKSKRARKGRAPMQVSSSLTLHQVKLRLLELLGLHPLNSQLYIRGAPADDDTATLADSEVYPGDEIRVVDKDVVDNGDLGGLFGGASGGGRQREFGFAGTALTGGRVGSIGAPPTGILELEPSMGPRAEPAAQPRVAIAGACPGALIDVIERPASDSADWDTEVPEVVEVGQASMPNMGDDEEEQLQLALALSVSEV